MTSQSISVWPPYIHLYHNLRLLCLSQSRNIITRNTTRRAIQVCSIRMVKDDKTVIKEFGELVNMTAGELEKWLGQEESAGAGWSKDDGSGETIGHESGRKIIAILEKNPKKDPKKYDDDDIPHMRKVVAYNKRHLAQEESAKKNPDSRSAKSLKNWGHDPQKA
ncbi:hypothetical protein KVT40_007953 [Elsinoe batatas]|uniref:Uncharacterized protein n=1 Tax=Elsinoe batatas TaxID=2601811 RepID=A0A8K0KT12_9PEZI|nr:hypothetical protein KVT40_007953 [Elsinoe batatas]